MITLYGMTSPNVTKIIIALEELEMPYELKTVDVFGGQQFDADFLKLNPSAKVPVIVDTDGPDGKPYTVFELGAILLYLAEKSGELLSDDLVKRYDAMQWLMVQLTGVGPMFGQFVHFMRFAPKGSDYAVDRYRTQVTRLLEVLDQRLGQAQYLGGADYSIADIATFPWARNAKMLVGEEKAASYKSMAAWIAKIDGRAAVKRALAKVEEMRPKLTAGDKAQPEMLDKVFGRGKFAAA